MNFLGLRNIEATFFIPAWFVLPCTIYKRWVYRILLACENKLDIRTTNRVD